MAGQLWTPLASMIGVLVGGGLTFLTQRTTLHAAERADERKRRIERAEARRAEQVAASTELLRFGNEAEGVAPARPPVWEVGDDRYATARPAIDGLRVAEARIMLLCPEPLHEPATAYAQSLNDAVWQDRDHPLGDSLEPGKLAFIAAAKESLTAGAGRPAPVPSGPSTARH